MISYTSQLIDISTFAEPCGAFVTEFKSFMNTGRCTWRNSSSMQSSFWDVSGSDGWRECGFTRDKVNFDGWITARVVDVTGEDLLNGHSKIESIEWGRIELLNGLTISSSWRWGRETNNLVVERLDVNCNMTIRDRRISVPERWLSDGLLYVERPPLSNSILPVCLTPIGQFIRQFSQIQSDSTARNRIGSSLAAVHCMTFWV